MVFSVFLWLLTWGGMFTGLENLKNPALLSSPIFLFQGVRALFPLLAVYIILIWVLGSKVRYPFSGNPLRFLLFYCTLGIIVSFFLSPDPLTSLYWAGLYLSPLLVMWFILDRADALKSLRWISYVNYGVFILITLMLLPEAMRGPRLGPVRAQFYNLPFKLGEMRANGVGRFALVVLIIAGVRLMSIKNKTRFLWIGILFPALYILAKSQSRTALLGLAISSILFILMKHLNWRLIFVGPFAAYVIWISGIEWRAQGRLDNLVDLSGRQMTWQRAIVQIKSSPFLGWGFHADRLLLNSEHMHNSFLHSLIHTGIIGTVYFLAAFIMAWLLIIKRSVLTRVRYVRGPDQPMLMESILFLGFLTSRGFFESTGAFYGVDLLLLVPSMAFIHLWIVNNPQTTPQS